MKRFRIAIVSALLLASAAGAAAETCDASFKAADDRMRQAYISGRASIAESTYSKRPAGYGKMSCLEDLMKTGNESLDIFFKPPTLQDLMGLVENFVCDAISQIFEGSSGGFQDILNKIGGGGGEIIPGINLGGLTGGGINVLGMGGARDGERYTIDATTLFSSQATRPSVKGITEIFQ